MRAPHSYNPPSHARPRPLFYAFLSTLLTSAVGSPAATIRTWTDGSSDGLWSTAGNWNPAGTPAAGDTLFVAGTNAFNQTVTYDYTGAPVVISALTISATNTLLTNNNPALDMTANSLTVTSEFIADSSAGGSRAKGRVNQTGGINNATTLTLGNAITDLGTYSLSGTGILNATQLTIAQGGTATLSQSGGTLGFGNLSLASGIGSVGSLTLSGGSMSNFNGVTFIGQQGIATFNQTGGVLTLPGPINIFYIGYAAGATGTWNFNGGTLNLPSLAYLGATGNAIVNQTTGSLTSLSTGGSLVLARDASAHAVYTMSGGSITFTERQEFIGYAGTASFLQSAGVHTISSTGNTVLTLGALAGSSGSYSLSGGTLDLTTGDAFVGAKGNGTFSQTSGVFNVGNLVLGTDVGGNGTYTLSGNSTINAHFVGAGKPGGFGSFTQNGGVINVNTIGVANDTASASGLFSLLAGTIILTPDNTGNNSIYVGGGNGTLTQSGGLITNSSNSTANLLLASAVGSTGRYELTNGTLTFSHAFELIGEFGDGIFNQTGGINSVSGASAMAIGYSNTSTGIYSLSGGTLTIPAIYVGGGSAGPAGKGTLTSNTVNTLTVSNGITVYSTGTLSGTGSTTAAVNLLGGRIIPLNTSTSYFATYGSLTLGALTLNSGSRVFLQQEVFSPANTNAINVTAPGGLNFAGPSGIFLNGYFDSPRTLFTYSGSITGALANLTIYGGSAEKTYLPVNDTTNHAITFRTLQRAHDAEIVIVGQVVPGSGNNSFFTTPPLTFPYLNASGQVAFFATYSNSSDGTSNGIFLGAGATPIPIAKNTQPAPGVGGGTYNVFNGYASPTLSNAGQVLFEATLASTIDGSTDGLFRYDPASGVTNIMRDFQSIPGFPGQTLGAVVHGGFSIPQVSPINASDQVAFVAGINNATDGTLSGVFLGGGNSLVTIARHKQAAPGTGGGTFGSNFGWVNSTPLPGLNSSGQVAFIAQLTGTSDGSTLGVFRGDGTSLVAIAREKQPLPGAGGGSFGSTFLPTESQPPIAINDAGQVAFYNFGFSGTSDGATQGLFRGDGTSLVVIARETRPAPGAGGGTFGGGQLTTFSTPVMNNAGQVAFLSVLTGTSDSSSLGWFRSDGSSIVAIARGMQTAPGTGGGKFSNAALGGITANLNAIGPGGQVAFLSGITSAFDPSINEGLFIGDGQEIVPIALTGQVLPNNNPGSFAGTLFDFILGRNAVNQYGQVAYVGRFSFGGSGDYVFTPVLHWRAASSGAWDTAANWTLGLPPAFVHDVTIDPASSLAITGPANPTTIKTLTLGGNPGIPTLHLSTGSLKVTALSIAGATNAWSGKLDLASSALILQTASPAEKSAAIPTLQNQILSAKNNGLWTGNGITSSSIPVTPNTSLALADNADLHLTTFRGQSLDDNALILLQAHNGDANLDQKVDALDLNLLAAHWQQPTGALWSAGDFTGDGKVDALDLNLLAANWQSGVPLIPAFYPLTFELLTSSSSIPEPASLTFLLPAPLLRRRHNSTTRLR